MSRKRIEPKSQNAKAFAVAAKRLIVQLEEAVREFDVGHYHDVADLLSYVEYGVVGLVSLNTSVCVNGAVAASVCRDD